MSGAKFRIEVRGEEVIGRLGDDDLEPVELAYDRLELRTVTLLEDWLKRWEWIAGLEKHPPQDDPSAPAVRRPLLVHGTFQVLGIHLWRLLLSGTTGNELIKAYDAVGHDETLRVLISFDDGDRSRELASLPWEFLYYPGSAGRTGFFLTTRSQVVLSRYLPRRAKAPGPRGTRLRVVFWVTLPGSAEFDAERDRCKATRTTLMTDHRNN